MVSFYKYLKKGYSKNKAMRKAKLDYLETISDPALKHPYYWAGFIVYGNEMPVVGTNNGWIFFLVVMLLVALLFRKRLLQFF